MRSTGSTTSAPAGSGAAGGGPDRLDCEFAVLVAQLEIESLETVQARLGRWRARLDGVEARRCAERVGADGDLSGAKQAAAAAGNRSKRAADRAAKRAGAVAANPKLGDKMESGELSAEQVDAIAEAMETDPAAATDDELIDTVGSTSVDQGRRAARDWARDRANADETQSEHDRQRRLRETAKYRDRQTGCDVIRLHGDRATIAALWKQITAYEKTLYQQDGGRDLSLDDHPRTRRQRLFDSMVELITGSRGTAGGGRPTVVFGVDLENLSANTPVGELVGHGPVADSVIIDALVAGASVFANVKLSGQTLWWGRQKRHGDANQYLALVVRDTGCVLCGAQPHLCDVHHLLPWSAPGQGHTHLENLALVCPGCHTTLHSANRTLYQTPAGTWATRPATSAETPAPRPDHRRQQPRHAQHAQRTQQAQNRRKAAVQGRQAPQHRPGARHRGAPRSDSTNRTPTTAGSASNTPGDDPS